MVHTTPAHALRFDVIPASPMIRLGTMKVQRFSSARAASAALGKPTITLAPRPSMVRAATALVITTSLLLTAAVVTDAVWRDAQERSTQQ